MNNAFEKAKQNKYVVTSKSLISNIIWTLLIFVVAGGYAFTSGDSGTAAVIGVIGLVLLLIIMKNGRERLGSSIEFMEDRLRFCEAGQNSEIIFADLVSVRYERLTRRGQPNFYVETKLGKKKTIKPEGYKNEEDLRQSLILAFADHGFTVEEI